MCTDTLPSILNQLNILDIAIDATAVERPWQAEPFKKLTGEFEFLPIGYCK